VVIDPGNDFENWIRVESEVIHPVPIEIADSAGELRVNAQMPGFSQRDIDVHLEPRRVIIRGKTEHTKERTSEEICYTEREGNQIFRSVTLPTEVDPDRASAALRDGVLELTLPKAGNARGTRVHVKTA
jgi:HSP20 family protein